VTKSNSKRKRERLESRGRRTPGRESMKGGERRSGEENKKDKSAAIIYRYT